MNREPARDQRLDRRRPQFDPRVNGQIAVEVDDAFAFRRLVGDRRDGSQFAQLGGRVVAQGQKLRRPAIAHRDRARLVQQQRVDIAGDFDRLAALGQHVGSQGAVHSGDADRRQECADRGGDQAHEQADERRHVGPQAFDRLRDTEIRLHVESRHSGPWATGRPSRSGRSA